MHNRPEEIRPEPANRIFTGIHGAPLTVPSLEPRRREGPHRAGMP